MISWYEEPVQWLAATVSSLRGFCDHVIAVDGAYFHFPGAEPTSTPEQAETIRETALAAGMGCTIHQPAEVWASEVEKRDFMFRAAAAVGTVGEDWVFPIDADQVVTYTAPDIRTLLKTATEDVAVGTLWWSYPLDPTVRSQNVYERALYRLLPSLRVEGAHYTYTAQPNGNRIVLRGLDAFHKLEPFLTLSSELQVRERQAERPHDRQVAKETYVRRREQYQIETPELSAV